MLALWLHAALLATTLAGIAWHRRFRASTSFVALLAWVFASKIAHITGAITPDRWRPYLFDHLVQALIVLGVAVEMGARIFHKNVLTGRVHVQRGVLLVLLIGLVAAFAWGRRMDAARTDADVYYALVEAERRVAATALYVFLTVFAVAVLGFHWPLDPYHRDIALGFGLYLSGVLLVSPAPQMPIRLPDSWPVWLYGAALLIWLRAAWRRDDFGHVAPRYRPLVFPWARHDS